MRKENKKEKVLARMLAEEELKSTQGAERYCGLPLLDAFVQFLLQGNTDFEWSDKAVSIRYGDPDLEAAATAKSRELLAAHVATN